MKTIRAPKHLSKEAKKIWKSLISEYAIEDIAGLKILRVDYTAKSLSRSKAII